jgi:hypothetical protein
MNSMFLVIRINFILSERKIQIYDPRRHILSPQMLVTLDCLQLLENDISTTIS